MNEKKLKIEFNIHNNFVHILLCSAIHLVFKINLQGK